MMTSADWLAVLALVVGPLALLLGLVEWERLRDRVRARRRGGLVDLTGAKPRQRERW